MLTVTVRFYVSIAGIGAGLILLWRISWILSRFMTRFEEHVKADDQRFHDVDADISTVQADIRELRRYRRTR